MRRVAAVDCGTNSIRLLVADADPASGRQHDLDRRLRIVRLGQDVDRTGRLDPQALERTMSALAEYAEVMRALEVERVRMIATSATRDASNSAEFVDGVRELLGVEPDVVSGDDEARLSFAGATREIHGDRRAPYLVVDVGGGSTEFVSGISEPESARSVDIGSVRLTERCFGSDPPTSAEVSAARKVIEAALDDAARTVPLIDAGTVIGLAGTITTVAAIHLGLAEYDSSAVHLSRIPAGAVAEISDRLLAASHEQRAAIRVIHPGRVDVIAAGALILRCVVERTGASGVLVSERDILDGIAWSLVADV
ncbi:Ppx/GppA family phosphatase [Actinobacteria bacterium YIM 96077]|uniref:Exopolyphosphatase n=1 Tax=Phytoactinopolyspora halophila TaxID=1981511 RepID=A0A329QHQ8_9ACTN|nr:Ppx/GppA phosphatase family protein [Phytoactinopolyspora halophila]AYY15654.1 Ppx/GppA family phosphatase [Actinobacteria bacterium YIM 96077]RAW11937.1 exopolyphosphatase [Phytoactinopolyspora halophila]